VLSRKKQEAKLLLG